MAWGWEKVSENGGKKSENVFSSIKAGETFVIKKRKEEKKKNANKDIGMGIGEKIIAENNFSQSWNRVSLSTQSFYYCLKNRFQFDAFLCRVFFSLFLIIYLYTRT